MAPAKFLPLSCQRLFQIALVVVGLALPSRSVAADGPRPAPLNSWPGYQAILWQPHRADQCAALKSIGITAGALIPDDKDDPAQALATQIAPFTACGLGWYVENIATDFYSAYHRWSPNHPVNWRFVEAKQAYRANPLDPAAFVRAPSLSDPVWLDKVRARLTKTVAAHKPYRPLFYSLGDEPGIADLSAFWDFDFSTPSLAAMRPWLEAQYGSLAALNREWGSHFATWRDVRPLTTAETMQRDDGNFSSWADFRAWMDEAFARAIRTGTRAVHAADPTARAAIEGAQVPGWGGYDYSRLATAVDVMELYDGGANLEIARALNPKLVLLTTSFGGASGPHDIWRELLRGSGGVVLWDAKDEIASSDASIGPRGRALAPTLHEIEDGIAALLRESRRQTAPIAMLYSPASMRTQWLLDWQPKGDAWSARDADNDYEDASAVRSSMEHFLGLLEHRGLEPRIVTDERIGNGALRRGGLRVLILPRAIALSARAVAEIRRFAAEGGTVIADGEPGLFDEHSRRLPKPRLAALFAHAPDPATAIFGFGKGRGVYLDPTTAAPRPLDQLLTEAGVVPAFGVHRKTGEPVTDVEIYRWLNGVATILALQRDAPDHEASAATGNDAEPILLTLPRPAYVYDLRQRRLLGHMERVEVALDAASPTLLAISSTPRGLPLSSGNYRERDR